MWSVQYYIFLASFVTFALGSHWGYSADFYNKLCPSLVRSEQLECGVYPTHHVETEYEKATFGMGCFWGAECLFGATLGVLNTRVGYSGGTTPNPKGDHTEVVELHYDPKVVKFEDLLELFWNNHEYGLTTKIKKQYASLILYHTDKQREIAEKSLKQEQERRNPEVITTLIVPASEFYPAEDYHQKYRLQSHKDLAESLGMTPELLQTSYVAAKLNGYLVGVGGVEQFQKEADNFGLTPSQKEYVRHHVEENEGGGLFC
ncbi:peptide methionine sulfoxide reductase isoform X2 [Hermetia illucens]|uniref:peptide methionine sulfoxide reductase isoform X2 n=1 Tax=Hermetia illucens TaxID=343691 RepID=UPI0018CC5B94|nr:peptide methionine sulfoxide reductase isoform X2 [Hermetia illucens]